MTFDSAQGLREQVLLSLQRALWDMVTSDLRGVAVGWSDAGIAVRFLYEGPITEEIEEIVQEVETEFLADFESDQVATFVAESLAGARSRESRKLTWWAYLRRETGRDAAAVIL